MIATRYTREAIRAALLSRDAFRPFASLRDTPRAAPEDSVWFLAEAGRAAAALPFPVLTAAAYGAYLRTGRDEAYSRPYFARRNATGALAMGCWLIDGSMVEPLADAIWQICEESSWLLPSHNYPPAGGTKRPLPDPYVHWVDLFGSETGALLSWCLYLNRERLDTREPRIGERIRGEVLRRVVLPYIERSDYWWMGYERDPGVVLNNWNPWCTTNVLAATLLTVDDPEIRLRVVMRAISVLDNFLAGYRDDGGCDEGTMYWGAAGGALYDALELIALATGGAVAFWDCPRIRAMLHYPVITHIHRDWYVNFADGDARLALPAELLWAAGRRLEDRELRALGAALFREGGSVVRPGTYYQVHRLLRALECRDEISLDTTEAPYPADAWLEGIQVLVARQSPGTHRGLYLAAKGGHNGESHSHNDVGSFVVFLDGSPLLVDPGTETYTARTFDRVERWKLWTTQSSWHNLPEINGRGQLPGAAYAAREVTAERTPQGARIRMEIAGAWPAEAGVRSWVREIAMERGENACVTLTDSFTLAVATSELTWCFITHPAPVDTAGCVLLETEAHTRLELRYDPAILAAATDPIDTTDPRTLAVWGPRLYRVRLTLTERRARGTLTFRLRPLATHPV